jgi:TolC family type I secretion outer membrane protein
MRKLKMNKITQLLFPVLIFTGFIFGQQDSLTINECVDIALKNNPQMKLAEGNYDYNYSNVVLTRSNLFPQISFNSGWLRNGGTFFQGPATYKLTYATYSAGFQGSLLITDFGKTYSKLSGFSDLADASSQDVINARQTLILNTYTAYFSYLQAIRLKKVSEESLTQATEHLKLSKSLYDVGRSPQFDVIKAESDEATARVNLINAENNIEINRLQFENILNIKLAPGFALKDEFEIERDSISESTSLDIAMQNRPEVIAAKYRVDANKSFVTSAWTANLPAISGTAGYNWKSFNIAGVYPESWSLGLTLSLPIFQGFALDAGIQQARANLDIAQSTYDLNIQAVTLDVRQQFSNLRLAQNQISASRSLLKTAEETLRLAEARFKEEIGSAVEVTDARVGYYNAQVLLIQALYNYQVTYARLERAMGTLK